MTYQPNIPLSTDLISVSQQDINDNFTANSTAFNVNHVDFNAAGAGKHKWVTVPEQASSPGTAANEMALYSKQGPDGATKIYVQQENLAPAGADVQLTGRSPSGTTNGETFLPGGFLLKWGQVVPAVSPTAVVFPSAFPNNCFAVALTINNNAPAFSATTNAVSKTGFDLYTTKTTVTHFYIAIGN